MESAFTNYRLAHLMYAKYGEGYETRFALVAQFVAFEIKAVFTADDMETLCNTSKASAILKVEHLLAFQKFFGFKNFADFFTDPEKMPVGFKNVEIC